MTSPIASLSYEAADHIRSAFISYHNRFLTLTRRAKPRFEQRAWQHTRQDQLERLDLYGRIVTPCVAAIRILLGDHIEDKAVWEEMKAAYVTLIEARPDREIAETFFNSVTRRVFSTIGVDASIEFVDFESTLEADMGKLPDRKSICRAYRPKADIAALVIDILRNCHFNTPFNDIERDSTLVAERIRHAVPDITRIDVINSIFFRGKSAYLIGRISDASGAAHPAHFTPLVITLQNGPDGLFIDTVLLTENETSILFSFTRSYFHVVSRHPYKLIAFLKSIMPLKPINELYISLGYNKHGKTVFYRELMRHMRYADDKFEIARGERGMVMIVFTLPDLGVVFKIIKDRFDFPKTATRKEVLASYELVFKHDRAGRLIDAQEFEHLAFPVERFQPALLDELLAVAGNTVSAENGVVSIDHLYTERQVTPLNLYLAEADEAHALAAALEYGQAIKDLASTNIFPGDLFLKNFGVTRHGRVVFYDYDELALITDCRFRRIPPPRSWEDEISDQPWFTIRPNDVFPEQFEQFIGLRPEHKIAFIERHGDLFDVRYWKRLQEQHRAGHIPDIYPYKPEKRFHPDQST